MPTAVEKLNWTFTDANGVVGSGAMRVNTQTGVVLSMSGTYEGKNIIFSSVTDNKSGIINGYHYSYHPNDPAGYNTLQGVPNTTGANYTYDDIYNTTLNPGTGVDPAGILVSTGAGKTKTYYDISLDYSGASQVDFFSIANDGQGTYVEDEGTFSTSPVGSAAASAFTQAAAAFGAGPSIGNGMSSHLTTPPRASLSLAVNSHHLG